MASRLPLGPRPRISFLVLLSSCVTLSACGDGSSGPDEDPGFLQISATDVDHLSPSLGGFDEDDVTSFRVRLLAGPRVVLDSTFARAGGIRHDFEVDANTYIVEVEAFQGADVVVLQGAGEATVAAGDTVPLTVDLDPAIGDIGLTIDGQTSATVPTNGSVPVEVTVRNQQGLPVEGAEIELQPVPAAAASIDFAGPARTGPDGSLEGTFLPNGGEFTGELQLTVDGFPVDFAAPRAFSIVSPVDVGMSRLTLTNTFRVPADGVSATDIDVLVVNRSGVPQANIPIEIVSSRNGGTEKIDTIRSAQSKTDAAGRFQATLTTNSSSNLAGDATITAVADGKTLAQSGEVSFLSIVSATGSEVHVAPQEVPANGTSSAEITATIRGHSGQPLGNVLVQIQTKDNSLFRIQPISGRTNAGGVFRSHISSTVKTGTIIDVFADGLKTSAVSFVLFQ
jgi:hypothetical protein